MIEWSPVYGPELDVPGVPQNAESGLSFTKGKMFKTNLDWAKDMEEILKDFKIFLKKGQFWFSEVGLVQTDGTVLKVRKEQIYQDWIFVD